MSGKCDNTKMAIAQTADGWTVQSDSGYTYKVWVDDESGDMRCNCVAGQHGRTCRHVQEVATRYPGAR